ncbi:MAG: hypothetical protein UV59_C0027G0021 [Candidatus Gottesmanbacteria bacterium GW2011_GWA1_43_11]|uniref:Uncharacterized protein n=1 Tax=Candidatus Gottesmanbacteria bacterium GW2011_GWA1_43_11 TaxID=1618436 RepID=A0A0G1FB96_9BACT|nr:MAG: hypothetical protein UV59_C0027G0021 [Candidatus Gottesmanbacteria bacterium GW2011_GWA1_43_11]
MYDGLFTDEEHKDRGILMKPTDRILVIDDTFNDVGNGTYEQTNPNRVFPPPVSSDSQS